jgi:hypothetical protein
MKNTTATFAKLSVAVIILLVTATAANAKRIKNPISLFGKQINMGVYNPGNTNEWSLAAKTQQKLHIQQVAGQTMTTSIVIKNNNGDVVYTGTLKDGAGDINIGGMEGGKYGVYIQNQGAEKIYKLIIE